MFDSFFKRGKNSRTPFAKKPAAGLGKKSPRAKRPPRDGPMRGSLRMALARSPNSFQFQGRARFSSSASDKALGRESHRQRASPGQGRSSKIIAERTTALLAPPTARYWSFRQSRFWACDGRTGMARQNHIVRQNSPKLVLKQGRRTLASSRRTFIARRRWTRSKNARQTARHSLFVKGAARRDVS